LLTEYSAIQNEDFVKDVFSHIGREIEILSNSHVKKLDVNFVSELKFNKIGDFNIFIGPYPQNEEDIALLSKSEITAVLNIQTDVDMTHRQINWKSNLEAYKKHCIDVIRYPIRDFDSDDLKVKIRGAAEILKELTEEGNNVYVHCTAGMSRAAAAVITYLVFNHYFSLDEAYDYVKFYRNIICPNMNVLSQIVPSYKTEEKEITSEI
jgi:protein tyrosine/serine phosphatase